MPGANPEEERKPDQGGEHINLKIMGQVKYLSLALSDSAEPSEDTGMSGAKPEEESKPYQGGEHINLKVKGLVKYLSLALSDSAERSEDIGMSGAHPEEERKPDQGGEHINLKGKGQVEYLSLTPERSEDIKMSGPNPEEERKPDHGGEHINVKVKRMDGSEVFFRIKRNTQLKNLMKAYCDRHPVGDHFFFFFNGRSLYGEQTPDELRMEDGDEINAFLNQRVC